MPRISPLVPAYEWTDEYSRCRSSAEDSCVRRDSLGAATLSGCTTLGSAAFGDVTGSTSSPMATSGSARPMPAAPLTPVSTQVAQGPYIPPTTSAAAVACHRHRLAPGRTQSQPASRCRRFQEPRPCPPSACSGPRADRSHLARFRPIVATPSLVVGSRQRLRPRDREWRVALHDRAPLRRDGAGDHPGQRLSARPTRSSSARRSIIPGRAGVWLAAADGRQHHDSAGRRRSPRSTPNTGNADRRARTRRSPMRLRSVEAAGTSKPLISLRSSR